jgi:hypothetical protein
MPGLRVDALPHPFQRLRIETCMMMRAIHLRIEMRAVMVISVSVSSVSIEYGGASSCGGY